MEWSWMVVGSEWTSPSQKDLTRQPLESTWDGLHSKPCVMKTQTECVDYSNLISKTKQFLHL